MLVSNNRHEYEIDINVQRRGSPSFTKQKPTHLVAFFHPVAPMLRAGPTPVISARNMHVIMKPDQGDLSYYEKYSILNFQYSCRVHSVEYVSKITSIPSIIFCAIYGAVYIKLT